MSDMMKLVKELGASNAVLNVELKQARADLAAARESEESYRQSLTDLHKVHCATVADLAAARELLREAREYVVQSGGIDGGPFDFIDRIDAALNKGETDE